MMKKTRPVMIIRPKRRRRFNWTIVAVPAAVLFAMWVANGIQIGFSWDSLLTAWRIHNKERFTQLACMGLLAVAVVAIARILRPEKQKDED
jgi:hypothetical protein